MFDLILMMICKLILYNYWVDLLKGWNVMDENILVGNYVIIK